MKLKEFNKKNITVQLEWKEWMCIVESLVASNSNENDPSKKIVKVMKEILVTNKCVPA